MISAGMDAKVLSGAITCEMNEFLYKMCLIKIAMIVGYGGPADVWALLLNSVQHFAEPVKPLQVFK